MKKSDICLCNNCIGAIRSRGEKVLKGDSVDTFGLEEDELPICEWCEEPQYELYECYF